MYKLLALDIDDTLTKVPTQAPAEIIAAVNRARAAGIRVMLATGRGYFASSCIVKQLEITEPVVNYGGSIISDPVDGHVIYSTEVSNDLIHSVLNDAAELGVHAHIYQQDTVIHEKPSEYADRYVATLGMPRVLDPDVRKKVWDNVPKILMMTTEEKAAELIPLFQKKYEGQLKVSGSSKGFIEVNNPLSHKGEGVKWVAEHLGFSQDEVVAVGDNSLDIEMIRWAGLGCAVANAKQEVKDAADLVIPSCEEHGVAWLIDNVLLKK